MWMSSSARENVKVPASISPAIRSSPAWIAAASSAETMPRCGQHGGMGLRARDVLRGEALVEADGGVDLFHDARRGRSRTGRPTSHCSSTASDGRRMTDGTEPDDRPHRAAAGGRGARGHRRSWRRSRPVVGGRIRRSAAPRQGSGAAACPRAAAATARLDPLVRGEVAALGAGRSRPGAEPDSPSRTPDGQPTTLADFKGKAVLVNLWATWCVPCRKEMPALDALQAQAGRAGLRGRGRQHRHGAARPAGRPS